MTDRSTLRIAIRTLRRHAGFTTVAILSLAVAIALNTTMYSVLDAMLAPHISARQPENLYTLRYFGDYKGRLSPGSIEQALRVNLKGFEGVTGSWPWYGAGITLAENGTANRRVQPAVVRTNFFDLLGTRALQGRTFLPSDEAEASAVVISDWLADQLFPGESPIGRSIVVGGESFSIIGVVERNQRFEPLASDVWRLRPAGASQFLPITLIRYSHKVDIRIAFEELRPIAAQLALAAGESPSDTRFYLVAFETKQFKLGRFHWALIGAVVAVLLVACANLANLQLARGLARSRELALRSAVGASRQQLVAGLLLESTILATAGLILGIVATLWSVQLAKSSIPPVMSQYIIQPQTSWRVFAFAAFATTVCLFLIGLLPALRVSRVDPDTLLKAGSGTGANREHRRRYGFMVIAQIGFALPVLIGAIVLLKSAWIVNSTGFLSRYGLGYDPTRIISIRAMASGRPGAALPLSDVSSQITSSVKSVPGVEEAAAYSFGWAVKRIVSVDHADGSILQVPANSWTYDLVSPSYFRAQGRAIARGRDFIDGELDGRSVIIDQSSAIFLFGGENPIGRAIKLGNAASSEPWLRVVGMVGDLRDSVTLARDYMFGRRLSGVYRVIGPQDSVSVGSRRSTNFLRVIAKANGSVELAAQRIARLMRAYNPEQASFVVPLADEFMLTQTRTQASFVSSLFTTFALLGIGLVAIGVYGIVSHSVAERKRELAVRISLGASARDVLRAVLREGVALILAGVAIGLALTKYSIFWLGNFMMSENDPYNAALFAGIAALLFGLATAAAFWPAWRATQIDPVEALRHE